MTPSPTYPLIAYLDGSAVLSTAFQEPGWEITARRMAEYRMLVSSNLLEAEVRAAYAREGRAFDISRIAGIGWIHPHRSLGPEMETALSAGGYLKAGDLWHIAVALYVDASVVGRMAFITLDNRQQEVAARLGFET